MEICRDLTFLLMSRRKLRVAALGVLSPELQALRNERAVAAKREVPKRERIRYKNIRVARVTCSVANRAHCFAHDSGGVSSDGAWMLRQKVAHHFKLLVALVVLTVLSRHLMSETIWRPPVRPFLDLPPFGMLKCEAYFLDEMI